MRNIFSLLIIASLLTWFATYYTFAQKVPNTHNTGYIYEVDLKNLVNDKIKVTLTYKSNKTLKDTTTFCLPKIIPGIYNATNFGKYVTTIKAFSTLNKELKVVQEGLNCWKIIKASTLKKITYQVSDGWEEFDFTDLRPYRSAESSFSKDRFILSPPSIFGYFKTLKNLPFTITIKKPKKLFGATALPKKITNQFLDTYKANNYLELLDSPLMYTVPDTTSLKINNTTINIASFNNSKKNISKKIATYIKPLIQAQIRYLGGKLPTNNYTFLLYKNNNPNKNSYFSEGLEHRNSTLVLMYIPEDINSIKETIYHTASHEFFHTIMPIGLHSYEIANFNFNSPKFSKHLWLYEGMTEYFTIHAAIKYNLVSLPDFLNTIENKIVKTKNYNANLSLVDLSINPIQHQSQYQNIYYKGALLNLCLDIMLRELSNGKYGVQNMVLDLVQEFGSKRPFEDDKLFDEITSVTGYPEIKTFLTQYVIQNKPLPLKKYLNKVGFNLNTTTYKITPVQKPSLQQKKTRKYWINQ
ncbi:conserved protein of unknown function [Tenacibaculum sp. 190524A02b]|uniref:M61 family metallopeptidase n=1 Tax=Tenacibaculum vairaonense TaxID=3137860 RepID=UPI0032B23A46